MGTGGYSIVKSWEMKKLHDQQKQQAQARVCKTCFFVEIFILKLISIFKTPPFSAHTPDQSANAKQCCCEP